MVTYKPSGHVYNNGVCIVCGFDRNNYYVGRTGPAGGYIFYDCDADNSSGNADGLVSSECGWRFLEVDTSVATVGSESYFVFGYYRNDRKTERNVLCIRAF